MGVKVIYSKISRDDLKDIFNFISEGSLKYARIEIAAIRAYITKFKFNIYLGKPFAEADDENLREAVFKNYRIIYEIETDQRIVVLTIHHHARLLSNNPAFKADDE